MAQPGSTDFFQHQDDARRTSRWLVAAYVAAVLAVAAAVSVLFSAFYALLALYAGLPIADGVDLGRSGLFTSYLQVLLFGVPAAFYLSVGGVALAVMIGASAHRLWQLREGGEAVAELLDASRLERSGALPGEVRALNVVEEMSIASGVSVPPVYVLRGEPTINALAAGFSPDEAVLILTEGAIAKLTRDELQGVIAHEFSHILNGDMRLNVQLLALLHGIVFIGQLGNRMVQQPGYSALGRSRGSTAKVGEVIGGSFLYLIGYFGLLAAQLIKSAISHQREFLADAASVQFTRNPEGIAGALDSTRSLHIGTHVGRPSVEEAAHMFFGQASSNWLGPAFSTHPPIQKRITRVHPRFNRDEYRRTRGGVHELGDVAVIDGSNTVVAVHRRGESPAGAAVPSRPEALGALAIAASVTQLVGHPDPSHLELARRILIDIPLPTRKRLASPEGALQVMFALTLERDAEPRAAELAALAERRGDAMARDADQASGEIGKVTRAYAFPLTELALPVLKRLPQPERDAFLDDLQRVIEADRRVTLSEFVLLAYLRQHLRAGAGRVESTHGNDVEALAEEARIVLSVLSHVSGGSSAEAAFAAGRASLGAPALTLLPAAELSTGRVGRALERLRGLAPLAKPRILKACVGAINADGVVRVAEAELLRTVAATLDCPLPPMPSLFDPATLAR